MVYFDDSPDESVTYGLVYEVDDGLDDPPARNPRPKPGQDRHGGGTDQVESVARKYKMTPDERNGFRHYIEKEKKGVGRGGAANLGYDALCALAEEYLADKRSSSGRRTGR